MRYMLLFLVMLVAACSSPVESLPLPSSATPMEPLSIYAEWEDDLEACAGMDADFSGVDWYKVAGDGWTDTEGRYVYGTYRTSGAILIAEAFVESEGRVKHEMGHHLAWTIQGATDHPDPPFGSCATRSH